MSDVPTENQGLAGLRVVSFESRRGAAMAQLIQQSGGEAIIAPSLREVPLSENTDAFLFGEKLLRGEIDVVVFLTGVGTETLFQVLQTRYSQPQLVAALSKLLLVARGPKPFEALHRMGLSPVAAAEPATWREVLAAIDAHGPLKDQSVAIQEYGVPNNELIDALAQRGTRVLRVPVYRWTLPEDKEPLRAALRRVIGGHADVVLFTNSNQINHVIRFAQEEGLEQPLRDALSRIVVASVGPVCTHFLDEYGVPVDLQPEEPHMETLVQEASRRGAGILERKRRSVGEPEKGGTGEAEISAIGVSPTLRRSDAPSSLQQSPFLKACRGEVTPYTPIWLMRQAGRYMKEYRDLRERHSFLDLCKDSDLACEVSVYAAERLGVDAAIVFSDILLILEPMGLNLEYAKGEGPLIHNPVRSPADIAALRVLASEEPLGFVSDALRKTRRALPAELPLIGFAGAPFTLASYMIEGQGSRNFIQTKTLMYQYPDAWGTLMDKIADSLILYLNAQIAAGADAVQLFDSWVGCLSPHDYARYVLPYSRKVIQGLKAGIPVLHFGTQTGPLLELLREAGGDVIGLDWRVELDAAWVRLGNVAIQGNLDPAALFADLPEIRRQARRILDQAGGRPGHIFNLGHGVLPNTPVGHVKALVDMVHELSSKR